MEREIELKLELDPSSAPPSAGRLGFEGGRSKRLVATYFDTPDGALRRRGVSLRVRRAGDAYVQTIKVDRDGGAGLFDRAEWETPLPDETPDLSVVDGAGLRDALDDPRDWDALRPAFAVDVERTVWTASPDGGSAEVVLDRGSVLADGAQEAVSEIELELTGGAPAVLFALARRLTDELPVRLGVLTKAERGFRLLDGRSGRPAKAEPLVLSPEASTPEAFAAIVRACLRHFRLNEPLIGRRDASGLHQARVALRRLRSAISLFRDVVADAQTDAIRTALRGLAATLGDARNLDVLIDRLDPGEGATLAAVRREREAAYDRALAALATPAIRGLLVDVLAWSEVGAWRTRPAPEARHLVTEPARAFAARVLDRYRRRVRKRGAGLAALDPEARHRVRIEAKKLRYAAEFFVALFDDRKAQRRAKTFLTALEELQSRLGTLNDIATGEELARELSAKGIELPPAADGVDEARLVDVAAAAHDGFADAKPFWR